jgi:hypothetical protein
MKSETDAPDDGRAIRQEQVGRNTPSSDSEIRCVSHKVAQDSQSGTYRLITIRAIGRTVSPYRSGVNA